MLSKWFSDKGLTKKAYLNSLAAALDYGARLVVGFVINPLLVAGLGNYGYGAWQVLGRLVGYIGPAGGRPTQALKWVIANQQASTDYENKRRYVGSAIAVWLLFLPLLASLGTVLAWYAPVWLKAPPDYFYSVRFAAFLLVANVAVVSLVNLPRSVLTGENLGYKRMGMSALLVFVGGGLAALALYFDTGLVGVACAYLATSLLTGCLFLWVVRHYVPWFGMARPSFSITRRFLGLSAWFLAWSLIMVLMRGSDVVVLGVLGSVEWVTTYTLTRYAPETLINMVAIVVSSITPGLGGVIGSGNLQKAGRVRNEIMLFTWLLISVLGTTVLLWNRSFVQLWVGPEHYAGNFNNLLILLMIVQFVLIRNDANIIDLTLNLRRKVLIGLLSVVLSIAMAAIAVAYLKMGIIGLCLGFISGRIILSLAYPLLVGHFLGVSLNTQLKRALRPAIVLGFLFALALILNESLAVDTWLGLVLSVGATVILASLLSLYFGLSDIQRQQVLHRLRLVLSR